MPASTDTITLPTGLTAEDAAHAISSFLLPMRRRGKDLDEWPAKKKGNDGWQLDWSNDYFLHPVEGGVRIDCRYDSQKPTIDAMAALFCARFLNRS